MKVAKHFVAAPPTDQANNICVNMGTKQGHRTGGAKGTGRDIAGKETESWAQERDGGFERGRDVGRRNVMPFSVVKVASKGCGEVGVVESGMKDAVAEADNGAQLRVSGAREANDFTTHTVFLRCECKGGERGRADVGISGKEKVEAASSDPKLDIAETKGGGLTGGDRVFTGPKEIKERDAAHVSNGKIGGRRGSMCHGHEATKNLDGNGFDPIWRRVFFLVGREHALDAKINVASGS